MEISQTSGPEFLRGLARPLQRLVLCFSAIRALVFGFDRGRFQLRHRGCRLQPRRDRRQDELGERREVRQAAEVRPDEAGGVGGGGGGGVLGDGQLGGAGRRQVERHEVLVGLAMLASLKW